MSVADSSLADPGELNCLLGPGYRIHPGKQLRGERQTSLSLLGFKCKRNPWILILRTALEEFGLGKDHMNMYEYIFHLVDRFQVYPHITCETCCLLSWNLNLVCFFFSFFLFSILKAFLFLSFVLHSNHSSSSSQVKSPMRSQ